MRRSFLGCLLAGLLAAACGDDDGDGTDMDASSSCSDDEDCNDGLFCNGEESCEMGSCEPGEPPCASGQVCGETEDSCATACDEGSDADNDGYAAVECGGLDCDDSDPQRYPGNTEICDAADHDEDCDSTTFGFRDSDMDGSPDSACCNADGSDMICGTDCDDANPAIHPAEAESCDGFDNDCDGNVDETIGSITYYPDCDGDMFGDTLAAGVMGCSPPTDPPDCAGGAWTDNNSDCDDSSNSVNVGATEVCNGIDDDCDGQLDGPNEDDDGDGWPDVCASLPAAETDCDDTDADVYPGAPEECDGVLKDCLHTVPEDLDEDMAVATDAMCTGGPYPREDCDDNRDDVGPGINDACNGLDDDCDSMVDEDATGCPSISWVNRYQATQELQILSVSSDGSGGIYATGLFAGDIDFGGGVMSSTLNAFHEPTTDIFLLKLNSLGEFVWVESFGSTYSDWGSDVELGDVDGHIYLTGQFGQTVNFGGSDLVADAGDADTGIFVASFTSDGVHRWSTSWSTNFSDRGVDLHFDSSGNLYLGADFFETLTFGGDTLGTGSSSNDALTARLNPANGDPVWARWHGPNGTDQLSSITVDADGLVYAALGVSVGSVMGQPNVTASIHRWTSSGVAQPPYHLERTLPPLALASAGSGAYVVGSAEPGASVGGTPLPDPPPIGMSGSQPPAFVLQIDGAGVPVWSQTIGGAGPIRRFAAIEQADGGITVAASVLGSSDLDGGLSAPERRVSDKPKKTAEHYGEDILVARFDAAGSLVWARMIGGVESDYPEDLAPFGRDFIMVGQTSGASRDFGSEPGGGFIMRMLVTD